MKELMHCNDVVATLSEYGNQIVSVDNVNALPVGVPFRGNLTLTQHYFDTWFSTRAIPHDRQNFAKLTRVFGPLDAALMKSMAVSLTDCYWIREQGTTYTWEDVTFHGRHFSENLADVSFLHTDINSASFDSPDFTTNGCLTKGWSVVEGVPCLIKSGNLNSNMNNVLCANEIVVSEFCQRAEIPCAEYRPIQICSDAQKTLLCASECFVEDSHTDFVSALQMEHQYRKFGKDLLQVFNDLGMKRDIDAMLCVDSVFFNTDRHQQNFGILMDVNDGDIVFAPLFDNGTCLGSVNTSEVKPFYNDIEKQTKLIRHNNNTEDFSPVPLSKIRGKVVYHTNLFAPIVRKIHHLSEV